jgi:hypothetical protein
MTQIDFEPTQRNISPTKSDPKIKLKQKAKRFQNKQNKFKM